MDTHCRLQDVFYAAGHSGTFAEFRLTQRHSFPYAYGGCVATFSSPADFQRCDQWEPLLQEDFLWGSFGCPPQRAEGYTEEVDKFLVHALSHESAVAVGKIGLDYSEGRWVGYEKQQKRVFIRQLTLAAQLGLPVTICSRDATHDTVRIVRERVGVDYPIHLQGFTGGWPEARFWLETFPRLCLGLTPALGLPGNQRLIEAAAKVPLDRVLFETNAPDFLPTLEVSRLPCSHQGMVVHVATQLSVVRELPVEEVVAVVRQNTRRMYGV